MGPVAAAMGTRPHLTSPLASLRCWGAASRDPFYPCYNAALDPVVYPSPDEALLMPLTYCHDPGVEDGVHVCSFGADPANAVGTVALIGDSHADALGPAILYVAEQNQWHG